jgi:hypothetical protein
MASKKPLVLDAQGNQQQVQDGDFIDVAVGGTGANTAPGALAALGAASGTSLTSEVNRATSAEATLTTDIGTAQAQADLGVTNAAAAQVTANAAATNTALTTEVARATAAEIAGIAAAKAYADSVVTTMWDDQGTFDASINTFPTTSVDVGGGVPNKGDIWTIGTVATAGPLIGLGTGTTVRAVIANPGQTVANWAIGAAGLGYVPYNATNPAGYISGNQNVIVSGDATGSGTTAIALAVTKMNGVSMAGLGTGLVKNTTGTGAPSIAVAADFPTLNQNTTGAAGSIKDGPETVTLQNSEVVTVAPGTPVYSSGANAFLRANGNAGNTSGVIGLASAGIAAAANGGIATGNVLTLTTAQWDAITGQTGGLTQSINYFLNTTTIGLLTSTVPTTGYLIVVGQALSATTMLINIGTKVQM